MPDVVGNPEDRFCRVAAYIICFGIRFDLKQTAFLTSDKNKWNENANDTHCNSNQHQTKINGTKMQMILSNKVTALHYQEMAQSERI